MKQKSLLTILVILTTLIFSGCVAEKIVYVDKPVPYAVPVKCEVPEVKCNFKGKGSEPILRLLECVVDQKKAMEVCNEN